MPSNGPLQNSRSESINFARPLGMVLGVIFMSMFYFPFSTTVAPGVNTKMLLAALGLAVAVVDLAKKGFGVVDCRFLTLLGLSLLLSFISFMSTTLNSTYDTSYSTYFLSMLTWLGAAFFAVRWIRWIHGEMSPFLIVCYLAGASVLQSLLAVSIASFPVVRHFVDSLLASEGFMGRTPGRLYGVGCALDVAGSRFAAVLIMMSFMIPVLLRRYGSPLSISLFFVSACIIVVVGCVIGRTTLIGVLLSLPALIFYLIFPDRDERFYKGLSKVSTCFRSMFFVVIGIFGGLLCYLYSTNPVCRSQVRFGFEGIFSLVEEGEWRVRSNRQLAGQFIFPRNLSTWLIGDGYFVGVYSNPYCVTDDVRSEYYKGTDVGYSRFLFYFGLPGLAVFILFIVMCARVSIVYMPEYRWMFLLLLVFAFVYWAKVASDLFPAFAPFIAAGIGMKGRSPSSLRRSHPI